MLEPQPERLLQKVHQSEHLDALLHVRFVRHVVHRTQRPHRDITDDNRYPDIKANVWLPGDHRVVLKVGVFGRIVDEQNVVARDNPGTEGLLPVDLPLVEADLADHALILAVEQRHMGHRDAVDRLHALRDASEGRVIAQIVRRQLVDDLLAHLFVSIGDRESGHTLGVVWGKASRIESHNE